MADDRLSGRRSPRPRNTGRVPFIWVQDDDTGHRYDVLETALRDGMSPVEGYEKNYTGRARPPKFRADLDGEPTTPPTPTVTAPAGEDASTSRTKKGGQ